MTTMPIVYVRESILSDMPFLIAAAGSAGFQTVNVPPTEAKWGETFDKSFQSFRATNNPSDRKYLFSVLSAPRQDAIPVGSSSLIAVNGTPEIPLFSYRIINEDNRRYLDLVENIHGPAEVGALVVYDACQGDKNIGKNIAIVSGGETYTIQPTGRYGLTASLVRFFLAGMPPIKANFEGRDCLSEFLPPYNLQDKERHRTNAFFEDIVRPVFRKSFDEIDQATGNNRNLFKELPRRVSIDSLPPQTQALIGIAGDGSQGAVRLLEQIGFKYADQVYPLDGGPDYIGLFDQNPIFTGIKEYLLQNHAPSLADSGWQYGFSGYYNKDRNPCFAACSGPVFLDGNSVHLPRETSQILNLSPGEPVTICLIPERDKT